MNAVRAKLDWFEAVILPHQGALRARLRRLTRSADELDDRVAEVLTRAYATREWERIDAGRSFLFAIARNLMIDEARRSKIVAFEAIADLDRLQSDSDLEAQLHARDELRLVQTIVERLPPKPRRVFLSRRVQEKSPSEIAEEMGLSVSTVEKHLARAVGHLTEAMAKCEEAGFERGHGGCRRETGGETGRAATHRGSGRNPVRTGDAEP